MYVSRTSPGFVSARDAADALVLEDGGHEDGLDLLLHQLRHALEVAEEQGIIQHPTQVENSDTKVLGDPSGLSKPIVDFDVKVAF